MFQYKYNNETFNSTYQLRRAIWENEKIAYGNYVSQEDFDNDENLKEKVVVIELPDPEPSLEDLKKQKLQVLEQKFLQWYEQDAVVTSSLGFVADSDVRAVTDVSGLITVAEVTPAESRTTVAFMDHVNQLHMLNLDQLKILQLEIIQNGQAAYQRKWELRTAIESAKDKEALEAIEIFFTGSNFSLPKEDKEEEKIESSLPEIGV